MLKFGDPHTPIQVQSYRKASFRLEARIKVDPDYLPEKVLAAVDESLRSEFSFDHRSFGQPVTLSEVVSIIQKVPGVAATEVTKLYRTDGPQGISFYLGADVPQQGMYSAAAAELLMLDTSPIHLEVIT
jgi:hypothetical protein